MGVSTSVLIEMLCVCITFGVFTFFLGLAIGIGDRAGREKVLSQDRDYWRNLKVWGERQMSDDIFDRVMEAYGIIRYPDAHLPTPSHNGYVPANWGETQAEMEVRLIKEREMYGDEYDIMETMEGVDYEK